MKCNEISANWASQRIKDLNMFTVIFSAIKNVLSADKNEAPEQLKKAISTIDRVATKGIIHNNNAARQKSKITKFVNNL